MTSNTGPILVFPRIQPFGSVDFSSLSKVYSRHVTDSANCENSTVCFGTPQVSEPFPLWSKDYFDLCRFAFTSLWGICVRMSIFDPLEHAPFVVHDLQILPFPSPTVWGIHGCCPSRALLLGDQLVLSLIFEDVVDHPSLSFKAIRLLCEKNIPNDTCTTTFRVVRRLWVGGWVGGCVCVCLWGVERRGGEEGTPDGTPGHHGDTRQDTSGPPPQTTDGGTVGRTDGGETFVLISRNGGIMSLALARTNETKRFPGWGHSAFPSPLLPPKSDNERSSWAKTLYLSYKLSTNYSNIFLSEDNRSSSQAWFNCSRLSLCNSKLSRSVMPIGRPWVLLVSKGEKIWYIICLPVNKVPFSSYCFQSSRSVFLLNARDDFTIPFTIFESSVSNSMLLVPQANPEWPRSSMLGLDQFLPALSNQLWTNWSWHNLSSDWDLPRPKSRCLRTKMKIDRLYSPQSDRLTCRSLRPKKRSDVDMKLPEEYVSKSSCGDVGKGSSNSLVDSSWRYLELSPKGARVSSWAMSLLSLFVFFTQICVGCCDCWQLSL